MLVPAFRQGLRERRFGIDLLGDDFPLLAEGLDAMPAGLLATATQALNRSAQYPPLAILT